MRSEHLTVRLALIGIITSPPSMTFGRRFRRMIFRTIWSQQLRSVTTTHRRMNLAWWAAMHTQFSPTSSSKTPTRPGLSRWETHGVKNSTMAIGQTGMAAFGHIRLGSRLAGLRTMMASSICPLKTTLSKFEILRSAMTQPIGTTPTTWTWTWAIMTRRVSQATSMSVERNAKVTTSFSKAVFASGFQSLLTPGRSVAAPNRAEQTARKFCI